MNFDRWFKKKVIRQYPDDVEALLVARNIFRIIRNDKEAKMFGKLLQKRSLDFPLCNNAVYRGVACEDCILYRHINKDCEKYVKLLLGKHPMVGVELFLEVLVWMETIVNQ